MAKYVGVTIGPIFDTMQLAESPAALWYSSAIFSKLTECILQKIKEKIDDAEIFSPFYNPEAEYTDGIGRYHDRVIFKTEKTELTAAAVDEAEEKVIAIILKDAGIAGEKDSIHALPSYDFLKKYFRIHTVFLDEKEVGETNAILRINPLLDALEQMYVFNTEGSANPIKALFSKNEAALNESRNAKIKSSLLLSNVVDSQLYKNKTLKSIEDICGKFDGLKKHKYFAIVSADGDGIGEFLSKTKNEDINNFSGDCFTYAKEVAEKIAKYGGMTVYAGGDDLLFLAPVEGERGTVFSLCNEISDLFKTTVAKNNAAPTVSFGISIRYCRFPLYEALNSAYDALYAAKSNKAFGKNNMVIDFQKHSGQAMKLCVPMEKYDAFKEVIDLVSSNEESVAHSVIYALQEYKAMLFAHADTEVIINVIKNHFDNEGQKKYEDFAKKIGTALAGYLTAEKARKIYLIEKEKTESGGKDEASEEVNLINKQFEEFKKELKCFEAMLRIGKFLTERGMENG